MEKEDLTELSKILYERLFNRFPEWQKYVEFLNSEYEIGKKSLFITIPSPVNKKHFLSILERGDCIEISYSDGNPQNASEYQTTGEQNLCVKSAVDFVEDVIGEKFIVGQKKSFWGLGNKLLSLDFIYSTDFQDKKFVNTYSWQGNFNKTSS
jgi:hypothetical protein